MKNKWLILVVLFPVFAVGQPRTGKPTLRLIPSIGFSAGESTAKPLFQLSGGYSYGRTFAGIGGGLDEYKFTSFPVFADWRWSFGSAREAFLYGNLGYNIAGRNTDEARKNPWAISTKYAGGLYTDIGIGYRLRFKSANSILFSAGFSQKNMRETVRNSTWCISPPCPETVNTNSYQLGRIIARFGWQFGN